MNQQISNFYIDEKFYEVKMNRFEQFSVECDGVTVQEGISWFEIIRYLSHVANRPTFKD